MSGSGGSRALHAVLGCLLSEGWTDVDSSELLGDLASLAVAANRLAAVQARLIAEVEARRQDGAYGGTRTTAELLAHVAPVTHREATVRVETACAMTPGRSLTGETLPAVAPLVADAAAAGRASAKQAAVIVDAVRQAREKADVTVGEIVEKTLVDACASEHVPGLRRMASRLLAVLDDDEVEPGEPAAAARALRIRRWRDGLTRFTLDLPALDAALVTTVVESLAAPTPAEDGDLDTRSAPQRRADAVVEVFARVTRSGTLPNTGGAPVTVLVTTTRDDLLSGAGSRSDAGTSTRPGVAVTEHGEPIPMPDLLAATHGDTALLPVVLDERGAVLHLGRAQRCASTEQRRALAARDRGCSFPGCDRPQPGPKLTTSPNGTPAAPPTSTTSPSSAANTTADSAPPAGQFRSPTAFPNGPHHPGSTPSNDSDATTPTTRPTPSSVLPSPERTRGDGREPSRPDG